jgi:hypothetical protein
LAQAVQNRLMMDNDACTIVVDHTLLHLLQPPPISEVAFSEILDTVVGLEGSGGGVASRRGEATHGMLIWCYGGFAGMETSTSCYPACCFEC